MYCCVLWCVQKRTRLEEMGFLAAAGRGLSLDQYGMFVADVWKLGHVFQEDDVDIGDAVNALYYQKHKRESFTA